MPAPRHRPALKAIRAHKEGLPHIQKRRCRRPFQLLVDRRPQLLRKKSGSREASGADHSHEQEFNYLAAYFAALAPARRPKV